MHKEVRNHRSPSVYFVYRSPSVTSFTIYFPFLYIIHYPFGVNFYQNISFGAGTIPFRSRCIIFHIYIALFFPYHILFLIYRKLYMLAMYMIHQYHTL